MTESPLQAVTTGDIVGSTDLPDQIRRNLPQTLREVYEELRRDFPDALSHDLAISSGDSWQILMTEPTCSLACTLRFWALLHARDITTRMALAIDTVDFISEHGLNESDGPVFRTSGRALTDLHDDQSFTLLLPDRVPTPARLATAGFAELVDLLLAEWTGPQSRAIAGILRTYGTAEEVTQARIAEEWHPEPVTRQTVNRHLQRAHWERLERTIDRFVRLTDTLSPQPSDV